MGAAGKQLSTERNPGWRTPALPHVDEGRSVISKDGSTRRCEEGSTPKAEELRFINGGFRDWDL